MVLTLAAAMHGAVVGAVAGGVRVGAGDCSLTVCALPAAVQRFLHGESSHVCYWKKWTEELTCVVSDTVPLRGLQGVPHMDRNGRPRRTCDAKIAL